MNLLRKKRRSLFVISVVLVSVFLFSKCIDQKKEVIINQKGQVFAEAEACVSCHKDVYDHFIHTAHNLSSQPATKESVKGSFNNDSSVYFYNYYSRIGLEDRGDHLYQTEYYKNEEKSVHSIDITIGSGTKGQSYLSWSDHKLFQLPVSYFTQPAKWANSPGFPSSTPQFNRTITARCLECHTTFVQSLAGTSQHTTDFDKKGIIYGISCERCHGPAQQHVDFQTQNPNEKKGKFIINPASLARQQKLDMCALCHSGTGEQSIQQAFSFTAGDTLANFIKPNHAVADPAKLDVHGNQYGLLTASKCFLKSKTMDCSTCHNTHNTERGNTVIFSQKCMTCHQQQECHFCKNNSSLSAKTASDCVSCHMPLKKSEMLTLQLEGEETATPVSVRSHLIAVYPEETQKIISFINAH